MAGALKSLKELFYRIGIKEPWKMTGVRSLPDYEHYLPKGHEYRKFAPGCVQRVLELGPPDHSRSCWGL